MQLVGILYADWYRDYWSRKDRIRESTKVGGKISGVQIYSLHIGYLKSRFFHGLLNFLHLTCLSPFSMEVTYGPHHTIQHLIISYHELFSNYFVQGRKTSPNGMPLLDPLC